jgi:cation transport protein ChaC
LAFVVATDHWEYAGKKSLEETAAIIATARGKRGANRDYLANTVAHLETLGLADGALHKLFRLVQRY